MTTPVQLAFLGCGRAARTHARVLGRVAPAVRLYFASREADRAASFGRALGGRDTFGSYERALEDSRVTAVVVATPPDRHLELTLAALSAGKDVVVEKPAFFEPQDFEVVRRAARDAARRVLVAENYFYKPLRGCLQELLEDGVVGEPLVLRLNAVKRQSPDGWRAERSRVGGGGLFEGGIHWINLISNLGMEVEALTGVRAGAPEEAGTEETILVAVRFRGTAVGSLAFSWEVPSPLKGVRLSTIYGRAGSIWFESNGIFVLARGVATRFMVPGIRDFSGYRAMWQDFIQALEGGAEPAMTLEMAERDVRFVRDIYRSFADADRSGDSGSGMDRSPGTRPGGDEGR